MGMHHELSYRGEVPGLLLLACLTASAAGGATGLADASAVLAALPADLVARFERDGWLLTRTYHGDVGRSLAEAFGTEDRASVESWLRTAPTDCRSRPASATAIRIGADVVRLLDDAYDAHAVREPWQSGDLLLVDNIRTAHSREPYEGTREILVGMAEPVRPTIPAAVRSSPGR